MNEKKKLLCPVRRHVARFNNGILERRTRHFTKRLRALWYVYTTCIKKKEPLPIVTIFISIISEPNADDGLLAMKTTTGFSWVCAHEWYALVSSYWNVHFFPIRQPQQYFVHVVKDLSQLRYPNTRYHWRKLGGETATLEKIKKGQCPQWYLI